MNDVAELVSQDLNLDVLRMLDIMLDIHHVITECILGLCLCRQECLLENILVPCDPHTLAAAAQRGLDHDRICGDVSEFQTFLDRVDCLRAAGNCRNACVHHGLLCLGLVA